MTFAAATLPVYFFTDHFLTSTLIVIQIIFCFSSRGQPYVNMHLHGKQPQ